MVIAGVFGIAWIFVLLTLVKKHRVMNSFFDGECLLSFVYFDEEEARLAVKANRLLKLNCDCCCAPPPEFEMETTFEGRPPIAYVSRRGFYLSSQGIVTWDGMTEFKRADLIEALNHKFIKITFETHTTNGPQEHSSYILVPVRSGGQISDERSLDPKFADELIDPNPIAQAAKIVHFLNTNREWRVTAGDVYDVLFILLQILRIVAMVAR
eukprot:TRINITY_DN4948_c0_g2_i1.p1 TRINITY_DN4948_c0_g2~~TRINITY_DN4948_c0_g2_i1.p1  ORF type:complete len:211 (+),score=63.33 TRINITY_DN4948_c0_g2_i1:749-1381(+)